MKSLALKPITLPSVSFAAGSTAQSVFDHAPKEEFGKPIHFAGITFDINVTSHANTTAPTTQAALNNIVRRLEIRDGKGNVRFQGNGFNAMRAKERLENGRELCPMPDFPAANAVSHWARHWAAFPQLMEGFPTDGLLSVAQMQGGAIDYTFGALTDYTADTTALVATITPTLWACVLDEVRIPPLYKWQEYAVTGQDFLVTGRQLVAYLGLLDSSAYGAITAADFGSISVQLGQGQLVNAVDAEVIGRMYQGIFGAGIIGGNQGEPRAATDDNIDIPDRVGGQTDLAKQVADLQVVHAAAPGCRLSKLYEADPLRVQWNGNQATGTVLALGSFVHQSQAVYGATLDHVLQKLGRARGPIVAKTFKRLDDPRKLARTAGYMPYAMKAA